MSKSKKKVKELACRFCGDRCSKERDKLSSWSHSHPANCPYRQDRMPSLNGVHVGDVWRNRHTKTEVRVIEIRLGGSGTYVDREPTVVLEDLDSRRWSSAHPLWSLTEHWQPITRPRRYPVPWKKDERFGKNGRSTRKDWRGPSYRGGSTEDESHAYWHAFHIVSGYVIDWESTNVIWQIDPELELREQERQRMLEAADRLDEDPYLSRVATQLREIYGQEVVTP
jgi:hypothetical protein